VKMPDSILPLKRCLGRARDLRRIKGLRPVQRSSVMVMAVEVVAWSAMRRLRGFSMWVGVIMLSRSVDWCSRVRNLDCQRTSANASIAHGAVSPAAKAEEATLFIEVDAPVDPFGHAIAASGCAPRPCVRAPMD